MKLSIEEVEHIAKLARLDLTEDEKRRYSEQLSDILEYAEMLDALDTADIPPTAHVLIKECRLQKDQPRHGLSRSELLDNAAETEDGQFKVPPVFGE